LDREERLDTAASGNSHTVSDRQEGIVLAEMQSGAPPAVSRQPTLEANQPPRRSNTYDDPAPEKFRILCEAFGSNALAHREFRIDLLTAFTELTISIKLIAVRGNGWFTAAGFSPVFGWFAVQTLLFLFHLREMSDMEMAATVRIAMTINAGLKKQASRWVNLFVVLHLPFFGYLAYLASFRPQFLEHTTEFVGTIKEHDLILSFAFTQISFWAVVIFICVLAPSGVRKLLALPAIVLFFSLHVS
jgi:uncharacterized membrane protein